MLLGIQKRPINQKIRPSHSVNGAQEIPVGVSRALVRAGLTVGLPDYVPAHQSICWAETKRSTLRQRGSALR